MTLTVALDARRVQDRPLHGVGRGLANLIPHLVPHVDLVLLFDDRRPQPAFAGCESVALPGLGRLPEPAWLQVSVARWLRRRSGVFHGPYNSIPYLCPVPAVVTLHDLAWEQHPEDYSSPARQRVIRAQARWSARHARAVVTVSEHIKASISAAYRTAADRITVVPNAVDPLFGPDRAGEAVVLKRRHRIDAPYLVALGGARRRGLEVSVEAWRRAARPAGLLLVVVGSEPPPPEEGIVYLGRLEDDEWAAVLAGAYAFCYPTRYEGFGMPALEAAASGVPVVCAPIGPLPEVLGDAAEWATSPAAPDMADAVKRLVDDAGRRVELIAAGLERAAGWPTWAESARRLLEVYERAAG